ncbi:hypothetical protein AVEN_138765-1 [Araneus ventricosus]|uniref:Uncharacterized protein n=1 Tax=Araneus ventricosus TaxID=182803 RepID=A0A4Y2FPB4_ARAVE|nr:hypothetical protein AVEN_138765-1 [Araneus ventricosus]
MGAWTVITVSNFFLRIISNVIFRGLSLGMPIQEIESGSSACVFISKNKILFARTLKNENTANSETTKVLAFLSVGHVHLTASWELLDIRIFSFLYVAINTLL